MREAHAKAGLTYQGRPSGVVYGCLQQLRRLMARFPGEVCCCWDAPRKTLHRRQFWLGYKANREGKGPSEAVADAYPQINLLRTELLSRLGLPNQFFQDGYEADDLIASLCQSRYWPSIKGIQWEVQNGQIESQIIKGVVIVSSDTDLYQLLGPRTVIYNLG